MAHFAPPKNLLRVSKAKKFEIKNWEEANYLESSSGRSLDDLFHRAASDRFRFAVNLLSVAEQLLRQRRPQYRAAVGRYYYAMYHAMRAAVFFHYRGDDNEEHAKLPSNAPPDLSNAATLANALKNARERRNQADYDPYPKADSAWRVTAAACQTDAKSLVLAIKDYLTSRGCRYL